jgi:serine/threonine protein kinase
MNTQTVFEIIAVVLGICLVIAIIIGLFAYVVTPVFKGIGRAIVHVFTFIADEIGDMLRLVGGTATAIVFVPLTLLSVLIGRWSRAAHYGRAISGEVSAVGSSLYRLVIGNPARLLCLTALTDGLERRLPEAIAQAPGPDRPNVKRLGQFEGYTIVGSLPGGGSGGKLFIATPDDLKQAAFARQGHAELGQVVIKTFSLHDGSSLPQIVRESRALEAAKKLGLVLDHELTNERFFYVTKYVPGESLGLVTQRLHAQTGGSGLSRTQLATVMGLAGDLLLTLRRYHEGGLWHKDVKPDNIIVGAGARPSAHLVDFGLVTPLRSGMTLTTHGTEYFRDPELVRLALKGVKVHQVDGAKFDLYAAGAVLFSMIENSFPAHGGLSQVTKPCPDALRWVVRRAMTDYEKRYPSAAAMLADLEIMQRAADPFEVKPADLPSVRGGQDELQAMPSETPVMIRAAASVVPALAAPLPAMAATSVAATPIGTPSSKPRLRVTNWWSGRYETDTGPVVVPAEPGTAQAKAPEAVQKIIEQPVQAAAEVGRRSAVEQLASARQRAREARARATQRASSRRGVRRQAGASSPDRGVEVALLLAVLVPAGIIAVLATTNWTKSRGPRPDPETRALVPIDLSELADREGAEQAEGQGRRDSAPGFRFEGFKALASRGMGEPRRPGLHVPPGPHTPLGARVPPGPHRPPGPRHEPEARPINGELTIDEIGRAAKVIETLVREGRLAIANPVKNGTGTSQETNDSIGRQLIRLMQSAQAMRMAGEALELEPDHERDGRALNRAYVLFVSDLTPPIDPETEARLTKAVDQLRMQGLGALGAFPLNPAVGAALESERALATRLKARVGLEPINSSTSAESIGAWIDEPDEVVGVIWVVPGGAAGRDGVYLFGPGAVADPARADAKLIEDWHAVRRALVAEPEPAMRGR